MSSFYACSSQKHKKDCQVKQLFPLLGFASVKAACRMLLKLNPVRNESERLFQCILCIAAFSNRSTYNPVFGKILILVIATIFENLCIKFGITPLLNLKQHEARYRNNFVNSLSFVKGFYHTNVTHEHYLKMLEF